MAGIFGIWNFDGRPLERSVLVRMGRRLAHRGPDGESLFVSGAAGMGCEIFRVTPESAHEVQPLVRGSGAAVVFDGRLDNRADLIATLRERHDVSACTPDAELVAASYESAGADFAARLAGDFSTAVLDLPSRRLLLSRDAIGVRPLYYWRQGGSIVFASEIKAILAHPDARARVDAAVLAEYLVSRLHRQPEDGTTFFQDVRTVPPAHTVVVTPDTLTVRRYWDFNTAARDERSFEAAAEGFAHHFRQAVQRRLRSARPVAVAVSGGLDSSSILCAALEMRRAGAPDVPEIVGLNYTPADRSPADESSFVEDIERFADVAIARVPIARGMLEQADASAWHAESPTRDCQWNTTRRVHMAVSQRNVRVLLTGHWGDQMLFDQAYLVDLARAGAWRTVGAHLKAYGEWHQGEDAAFFRRFFLLDLARHELPTSIRRSLRRMRQTFSRRRARGWYDEDFIRLAPRREFGSAEPAAGTAQARSLYREVRSRYTVHCLEWNNKIAAMSGLEMAFPFLDRDFIQFMLGVPGAVQNRDGVPKALLRGALRGTVPERILLRKSKADFTAVTSEGMKRDAAALASLLGPDSSCVAFGMVSPGTLRDSLPHAQAELDGRTALVSHRLADLAGLELFLKSFIKREDEA